ncbi:MAG: hypothetical protein IEMM0002_1298 [bacterium]|nr:MAG: hypothetical protein IEMM0002_1298 [bacterium]
MSVVKVKRKNPIKEGLQFIAESRNELRKVTWLSRKEVISITIVVVVSVFIVGIYLAVTDWGLSEIIKGLIRWWRGA